MVPVPPVAGSMAAGAPRVTAHLLTPPGEVMVVLDDPHAEAVAHAARHAASRPDLLRREGRGSVSIAANGCAQLSSEGYVLQERSQGSSAGNGLRSRTVAPTTGAAPRPPGQAARRGARAGRNC